LLFLAGVTIDPVVNFLKVELEQTAALHGRYPPLTCPLIDGVFADIQHVGNFLNTNKSSLNLHCIRVLDSLARVSLSAGPEIPHFWPLKAGIRQM